MTSAMQEWRAWDQLRVEAERAADRAPPAERAELYQRFCAVMATVPKGGRPAGMGAPPMPKREGPPAKRKAGWPSPWKDVA